MKNENNPSKIKGRVSAREASVFCTQTALLLQSGIPLSDGMESLITEGTAVNSPLRNIVSAMRETGSLYQAVKEADIFPAYMEKMINVGEKVGKLEEVMRSLGEYYDREDRLRSSARSVLMYPIMMILLMTAVIAVLVVAVFPVFTKVLQDLGAENANNASITDWGMTIGKAALVLIAVILAVIFIFLIISLTKKGRAFIMNLSSGLPIFKKVYKKIASGKFASVMSLTLSSGYHLDEALELAAGIVKGTVIEKDVTECIHMTQKGESFAAAVSQKKIFDDLQSRLLSAGEKTGSLDDVMKKTAARTQEEAENALSSLLALIEPTLVIVLSVVIGSILLSVMLPLIGIMESIT